MIMAKSSKSKLYSEDGGISFFSLFLVGRQKVTGGGYKELQGSALKLILSQGIQAWRT